MGRLEAATADDIPAIMALERGEGFESLVGRWDEAEHRAQLADRGNRYYVWRDAGAARGFAILQEVAESNLCALLRRICVQEPGRGDGSALLEAVIGEAFTTLGRHRLDLWVHTDNDRAFRCYRKAGFMEEGVARDLHRSPDGTFRSMRLMAILAPDWKADGAPPPGSQARPV